MVAQQEVQHAQRSIYLGDLIGLPVGDGAFHRIVQKGKAFVQLFDAYVNMCSQDPGVAGIGVIPDAIRQADALLQERQGFGNLPVEPILLSQRKQDPGACGIVGRPAERLAQAVESGAGYLRPRHRRRYASRQAIKNHCFR